MADWNTAYNWMMDNEDAPRSCASAPDAPPGAFAISGINSAAWPTEYAAIAAVSQTERAPLVQQFYENHFWNDWFAQLNSDDVSKRVFDFAVNGGSGVAVRCLQQAVNSLLAEGATTICEDGCWGPITLGAVNGADPAALVAAFQARRVAFYQGLVATDPGKGIYLKGWTARAEK